MTGLWERRCVPARSSGDDWSIRQVQEGLIKMGEGARGEGGMGEGDGVGRAEIHFVHKPKKTIMNRNPPGSALIPCSLSSLPENTECVHIYNGNQEWNWINTLQDGSMSLTWRTTNQTLVKQVVS